MINIITSGKFLTEKKYVLDVIFNEFFGVNYDLKIKPIGDKLVLDLQGKQIVTECDFLHGNSLKKFNYLTDLLTPSVKYINIPFSIEDDIPLIYGKDYFEHDENGIRCGLDIISTCFFMLSRVEEANSKVLDHHGRFPATESLAFKAKFLERPIVDEYIFLLLNMIMYLKPTLELKVKKSEKFITCDLDWPFDPIRRSLRKTLLKSAADVVKRRSPIDSILTWKRYIFYALGIKQNDAYRDAIDWIMDANEEAGNKVAFYFISKGTSSLDAEFDLLSEDMQELIRSINRRGHEIGLHPGYNCYDDDVNFCDSVNNLKEALSMAAIFQNVIGGRMHFLRWNCLTTPQLWEKFNLNYDSSLSFADVTGFRCGTSHEFSMFDLVNKRKLNIKQRPLINMECTIIAERYEGFGYSSETIERFKKFKALSTKYNGSYTLLWHNSHFSNDEDVSIYKELIK